MKPEEVDEPKQFKWKKYVEMDQQWRDFEDAHPGTGEKMVKKNKRAVKPAHRARTAEEFNPDYTEIKNDLKRIGLLAGMLLAILIALSFIL